jgi:hypothetical protein
MFYCVAPSDRMCRFVSCCSFHISCLHPDLCLCIHNRIANISACSAFLSDALDDSNMAERLNNCTQRKKRRRKKQQCPGWWNLGSYHTNHYLSSPHIQFKAAYIFWRGNQGRGRKAVQINREKNAYFLLLLFMMGCCYVGTIGWWLYQADWYISDSTHSRVPLLMECCSCQITFWTQMTFLCPENTGWPNKQTQPFKPKCVFLSYL